MTRLIVDGIANIVKSQLDDSVLDEDNHIVSIKGKYRVKQTTEDCLSGFSGGLFAYGLSDRET